MQNITETFGIEMTSFSNTVDGLISFQKNRVQPKLKITKAEYELFLQEYVFECIKGLNIGQAFCKKYKITDFILIHEKNLHFCSDYIYKTYVKK